MSLKHPIQPIDVVCGVHRFRSNAIVRALLDQYQTKAGCLDLNEIAKAVGNGKFEQADLDQLNQLLGYSVSGFVDMSEADPEIVRLSQKRSARLGDGDGKLGEEFEQVYDAVNDFLDERFPDMSKSSVGLGLLAIAVNVLREVGIPAETISYDAKKLGDLYEASEGAEGGPS